MYTLGHDFVPPPVHAGGLRYHGDSPMVCGLVKAGVVEARAYRQNETFEAAVRFARTEGIIPAPESAHAIRAAIEEAQAAKEAGEERTILFGLSGHGHFDLAAYDAYLGRHARGPGVLRGGPARRRSPRCRRHPGELPPPPSASVPWAASSTSRACPARARPWSPSCRWSPGRGGERPRARASGAAGVVRRVPPRPTGQQRRRLARAPRTGA